MTDIIIYTDEETLKHKQDKLEVDCDKSDDGTYFWELHNLPKDFNVGERIYFAVKGFIVGSFKACKIEDNCITWRADSWKPIENKVPQKAFQGFKYATDEWCVGCDKRKNETCDGCLYFEFKKRKEGGG